MSADQATDKLHLWLWEYTDEIGKRRRSTWRMTEAEAAHYKDAVKVEGSLELRTPLGNTGDWQKRDGRSQAHRAARGNQAKRSRRQARRVSGLRREKERDRQPRRLAVSLRCPVPRVRVDDGLREAARHRREAVERSTKENQIRVMMDSRFGDVLKAQETKPRTASCRRHRDFHIIATVGSAI